MAIANPKQEVQNTEELKAPNLDQGIIPEAGKERKLSPALQNKFESLTLQVETNFKKMSTLLDERKNYILTALNELHRKYQVEDAERLEKLTQIKATQEKLQKELDQFGNILDEMNAKCEKEIKELENNAPFLELEWNLAELQEAIQLSCTILDKKPPPLYLKKAMPVWRSENKSPLGLSMHKKRNGLALDPENGDIFVVTEAINRIEVFNCKGEFLRIINPIELKMPWGIIVENHCCYVSCDDNQTLVLKLHKITGQVVARCRPPNRIIGITMDEKKSVWGCSYHSKVVFVWNENNLQEINTIYYDTPFHKAGYTCAMQMQLTPGVMYILFRKCDYPVQCFNREGDLLRTIVSKYAINDSFHFCLDKELNIILSDTYADNIKIFTNEGKQFAILGQTGSSTYTGEDIMYGPAGIAITKEGRLVLCDRKINYWLMLF